MIKKYQEPRPETTKPAPPSAPEIVLDCINGGRSVDQFNSREPRGRSFVAVVVAIGTICASGWAAAQEKYSYNEWIRTVRGLSVHERSWKADPDGDGIPNVGEKLHHLSPVLPGASDPNWKNAPQVWLGRQGRPEFRYHVDPEAAAAGTIAHQLFTSTDLKKWTRAVPTTDGKGSYLVGPDARTLRQFFRLEYEFDPPPDAVPQPTFSSRSVRALGDYPGNKSHPWMVANCAWNSYRATYSDRWTNIRGGYDKLAANFRVEGDNIPVAIMLTADCFVDGPGKQMFVRLLVDGKPMAPADVILAVGRKPSIELGARSFEFTGRFDRGLHTVEAQWMVDKGGIGYMNGAGLLIRQSSLVTATPKSGLDIESDLDIWQDVPDLEVNVNTEKGEFLTATFSAEAYSEFGGTMIVQVLVDGVVAEPGPVVFVSDGFQGARSMAFGMEGLDAGLHEVRVQYSGNFDATVGLKDRTLVVSAGNDLSTSPVRIWFLSGNDWVHPAASGAFTTVLQKNILLPPDSDLSVIFSASVHQPEPVWEHFLTQVVLTIDGVPVPGSVTVFTASENPYGTHAFVFDAKHVNAGGAETFSEVAMKWRVLGLNASAVPGMSDRSMIISAKQHAVPDLAEAPFLGRGALKTEEEVKSFRVEPVFGKRNVLVILAIPKGIDDPVPDDLAVPKSLSGNGEPIPAIADLEEAFFGSSNSVADYYHEVSGGRIELVNAGVLGPFETDFDWTDYYEGPDGTWNGALSYQDIWIEAVTKAETAGFKFSDYDFDGDGYISSRNELAIVIVKPQIEPRGFVRDLWEGGDPKLRDGVYLDVITDLYMSDPKQDYVVAAHELGHLIFDLNDLYSLDLYSPSVPTRPGDFALMDGVSDRTSHLNPAYKLALGWVTPWIISENSDGVSLEDVKVSREVVVLPRIPSVTEDEYLILETRPAPSDNSRYDWDFPTPDSGVAVWHIIESSKDNETPPPSCSVPAADWSAQTGDDTVRRGIRLVRPAASFTSVNALWNSSKYDLEASGFSCDPARNVSQWADGSPAYAIRNFSDVRRSNDLRR